MTDATNGEALLPPIETDVDFDRHYIPLPGGWEVQTKGKGSTFRVVDTKSDDYMPMTGARYEHELLERMAREIHEAWNRRQPTASAGMVVVPREPTKAMCVAGETYEGGHWYDVWKNVLEAAMLSAAPSPNSSDQRQAHSGENAVTDSQGLGEPGRLPPHFPTGKHFTIEPHGDVYAIYQGRDWQHHGLNLGHLTECSPDMIALIERALNATVSMSPPADTTQDVSERGQEKTQ